MYYSVGKADWFPCGVVAVGALGDVKVNIHPNRADGISFYTERIIKKENLAMQLMPAVKEAASVKLLPIDGKYHVGTLTQSAEVKLISTPSTVTSGTASMSSGVVAPSQASGLRSKTRNMSPQSAKTITATPFSPTTRSDSPISPKGLRQANSWDEFTPYEPQVRAVASQSGPYSANNAPSLSSIALSGDTEMTIEDLTMEGNVFDPFNPQMKSKLLRGLGFPEEGAIIESMEEANAGAFNEGVWTVSNNTTTQRLVLKLVAETRHRYDCPTDTEGYMRLRGLQPNIVNETSLTFPLKIFQLRCPNGNRSKDLIVMREAAGNQLTSILYYKVEENEIDGLMQIFREFGSFMHRIHRAYKGMQHGDCQPSNVFYDIENGIFTLIDCADFGYGPFVAEGGEDDVEHFIVGLKTLLQWYGEQVIASCEREFRQGYAEGVAQAQAIG